MSTTEEISPLLPTTSTGADTEVQGTLISSDTEKALKTYGAIRICMALVAVVITISAIAKGYDAPCSNPLKGFLVFYLVVNTVMMMYTLFVLLGAKEASLLLKYKKTGAFLVTMVISGVFLIYAYKDGADCNHYIVMASRIVAPIELCFVLLEKCMYEFVYMKE